MYITDGYDAQLPAALLEEPYGRPQQYGQAPYGHAFDTVANGSQVTGSAWVEDWRGQYDVPADYQGYGGPVAACVGPYSAPTDWDPHTGLTLSQPLIRGYSGADWLQTTTLAELRAGSDIMFPTSGQQDPGADPILITIPFDPGHDVGWQLEHYDQGRRMLYQQPPDYSAQTAFTPAAGF